MQQKPVKEIATREEARQIAIDWQDRQSRKSMHYSEVAEWYSYFRALGMKFNLIREFRENGII